MVPEMDGAVGSCRDGVIVRLERGNWVRCKTSVNGSGSTKHIKYKEYWRVNASGTQQVHGLVSKTFLSSQPKNTVVDHIDNNTANNSASNLRWITQKENCCRAISNWGFYLEERRNKVRPWRIKNIHDMIAFKGKSKKNRFQIV